MSELDDLLDPSIKNTGGNDNYNVSGDKLPNANAVLTLGIISIVGCLFYGIPGLACGIIALVLHKKDKMVHATDPARFEASFKNSKAGFICAIIGTSLSAVMFFVLIFYIFFAITAFNTLTRF